MLFDCLYVVVEFFEVVVDGCRSFLLLVTTQNEVNNCGNVTWTEGQVIGPGYRSKTYSTFIPLLGGQEF